MNQLAKINNIPSSIYWIRGKKVIMDRDLATRYGIETRALKQAARRNAEWFPEDFIFQLTEEEVEMMVSQNVIPSKSLLDTEENPPVSNKAKHVLPSLSSTRTLQKPQR